LEAKIRGVTGGKTKLFVAILALTTLSAVAYHNIFSNSFVNWDDPHLIINNKLIRSIDLVNIFKEFHLIYPPLNVLSHAIDYHFWKLNPWGYHLTNLSLQILNTILIFIIFNLIFQNMRIALFTGLLFAVHPIHVESVTWLSSRKDVLSMFFFLLSFLFYVKNTKASRKVAHIYFMGSAIFFTFSLLSKLTTVTLPFILILYDFLIDGKRCWNKIILNKIPFFIIIGIIFTIGFSLRPIGEVTKNYLGGSFYLTMLTMITVIVEYMAMLLLPVNLNANYTVSIKKSLFEPKVLFSVSILILVFWIMIKSYKRSKLITFCFAWFFITLLPVCNIIPITILPKADRYLYLPSIGFCLLFAFFLVKIASLNIKLPRKFFSLFSILILVTTVTIYTVTCIKRNTIWRNSLSLWQDVIKKSPNNYHAHNNLGIAYAKEGLLNKAISEYKQAIRINPAFAYAHNNLGMAYAHQGKYSSAIKEYKKAIELGLNGIYAASVYINLGNLYKTQGRYKEALKAYKKALELNPLYLDNSEILCNLAEVYRYRGLLSEAIAMYEKALEANPKPNNKLNILFKLGNIYTSERLFNKAINMYKKALDINPNSVSIRNNLGNVYANQGLWNQAVYEYKKAIEIGPTYANTYYNLGNAYAQKGLNSEAIRSYKLFLKYWKGNKKYRHIVEGKIERLLDSKH